MNIGQVMIIWSGDSCDSFPRFGVFNDPIVLQGESIWDNSFSTHWESNFHIVTQWENKINLGNFKIPNVCKICSCYDKPLALNSYCNVTYEVGSVLLSIAYIALSKMEKAIVS